MNRNVLLVGAGALGSRHLQSLAGSTRVQSVTVVEPNPKARETATMRWAEIATGSDKTLIFAELDDLTSAFDAAIIATPSPGRLRILEAVVALGCERILCEKVLFQTERDLDSALEVVKRHGTDVRVNHVYRYAEAFVELRGRSQPAATRVTVRIGGDGMGCNLIHYLDLLEYLSLSRLAELEVGINTVHTSKRGPAFVEFCGRATAVTNCGARLDLAYVEGQASAPVITVENADGRVVIDEGTGSVQSTLHDFSVTSFSAPRVSVLTSVVIEDLWDQTCLLPTLMETSTANRLMLAHFNHQIHGRHDRDLICPIT